MIPIRIRFMLTCTRCGTELEGDIVEASVPCLSNGNEPTDIEIAVNTLHQCDKVLEIEIKED